MVASLSFRGSTLLLILVLSCAVPVPVRGQCNSCLSLPTDTWGGGTGNWSSCNWSTGCPPSSTQDCIFTGGSVVTDDTAGLCNNFTLASGDTLTIGTPSATTAYLDLFGTNIGNSGVITLTQLSYISLISGALVQLSGGGTITLTTSNNSIGGSPGLGPTLQNVDNTIQGQGSIGTGMALINQKTITASGGTLIIEPTGMTNSGLVQAASGATLEFAGAFTINNSGATIQALNGSTVMFGSEAISGGTVTSIGTGFFETLPGGASPTLSGLTFSGKYTIPSGAGIFLLGTINNIGVFQTQGQLSMAGVTTLQGSGSVNIQPGGSLQASNGGTLTNQQLIHGAGTISALPLVNQGTIRADNSSAPLFLSQGTTTNTATLEATSGGTLEIANTLNNTGGTVLAANGSTVILSGTLNGGMLKTNGTGVLECEGGTLDGTVNVPTNAGLLSVPNNYDLYAKGTIRNTGTIALGGNSSLINQQPLTLTGSGKLTMSSSTIFGQGNTFTNQSTIEGSGTIGDSNPMPITNSGTIMANQTTPLYIVSNSTGFTNNGKLVVASGSTLIVQGVFNTLSNGTLTGGTYSVTGTLEVPNAITTNEANITLTGAPAQILNSLTNTSALATLGVNGAKGTLALQSGQSLSTSTSFRNTGTVSVAAGCAFQVGGTFTQAGGTTTATGALTAASGLRINGGTMQGQGTLTGAVTSGGTIIAGDSTTTAGLLTVVGSYTQKAAGSLDVAIGSTAPGTGYSQLAVSHGVSLGGTLNIALTGGFVPAIGDTFTIVSGKAITGQFSTVNGTSINSGEHFQVNYGGATVTLTVVSGAA